MKTSGTSNETKALLIQVLGAELQAIAEFTYTPGQEMSMYGGPDHLGWPEEPPEIELEALWIGEGKSRVNLYPAFSVEEITSIEDSILEEGPEEDY